MKPLSKTAQILSLIESKLRAITEVRTNLEYCTDYNYSVYNLNKKANFYCFSFAITDTNTGCPICFIDYNTRETLGWYNNDLLTSKYVFLNSMREQIEQSSIPIIFISEDMKIEDIMYLLDKNLLTILDRLK